MCFNSFQHGSAIQQSRKWGWKKRNEPQLQDLWKAPLLVDCLHCHISSWSFWKCSLFDIVSRRIRSSTDYLHWRLEFILVDRSWPGDAATKSYGKYESHMVSMVLRSTRLSRILGPISYCIWYDMQGPPGAKIEKDLLNDMFPGGKFGAFNSIRSLRNHNGELQE